MDEITEAERVKLEEWTRSAIDAAIYTGLVTLPWRPGEHVYGALHGYYTAGLTPSEGAEALFATRQ